jgi:radical SAM superfamily enzyme YgiQ (UPF0313 family)
MYLPFEYDEPIFRPPSEAMSAIFQITHGCSWNQCAFCEMYTSKKFTVKKIELIEKEIRSYSEFDQEVSKCFLADGDVMVLSTSKILQVLELIKKYLPNVRRISAYASPGNLVRKSPEELEELSEAGLSLVYVGIESGNDHLLDLVNKGETYESTVNGLIKAKKAGIKTSVMIIMGLGGIEYSEDHAKDSAKAINAIQPDFLSILILSFPFGVNHYRSRFKGDFIPLDVKGLLNEMYNFIYHIDGAIIEKQIVFRSDHASNYLALKGFLPRDKENFLKKLSFAINKPENAKLRKEWQRGL